MITSESPLFARVDLGPKHHLSAKRMVDAALTLSSGNAENFFLQNGYLNWKPDKSHGMLYIYSM